MDVRSDEIRRHGVERSRTRGLKHLLCGLHPNRCFADLNCTLVKIETIQVVFQNGAANVASLGDLAFLFIHAIEDVKSFQQEMARTACGIKESDIAHWLPVYWYSMRIFDEVFPSLRELCLRIHTGPRRTQ